MHLVCVNRRFPGMQSLRQHVFRRLGKLEGPTLFLFSEDAMDSFGKGGVQLHHQVKDWANELAPHLPRRCKLVFSTFEQTGNSLSNTAYVVSTEGQRSKPKQTLTKMDRHAFSELASRTRKILRPEDWIRRRERFSKKPYLEFTHAGHAFEVRVCADVNGKSEPDPARITLVPAARYLIEDMDYAGETDIARHRRLVVFNDADRKHVVGLAHRNNRNVIIAESELYKTLEAFGIHLHVDR